MAFILIISPYIGFGVGYGVPCYTTGRLSSEVRGRRRLLSTQSFNTAKSMKPVRERLFASPAAGCWMSADRHASAQ